MSTFNVIRAWKDPDYRRSLTEAQQAQLPAHPSGAIEFPAREGEITVGLQRPFNPCHKCALC
jgi:mersacidin/lichenicidin family type 2 lantibiotic